MTRRIVLSLLLLALPALCTAEEKKAAKRSYVGVMIAAGKDKGTILVTAVFAGGPADKAGLQVGDLILKIDGAVPQDLQTAVKVIGALKAGRKAALLVRRDGKETEIEVVPAARDD